MLVVNVLPELCLSFRLRSALQRYHLPEPRSNLSEVLAYGSAAFRTDDRVVLL
ncbi:hypothetical protein P692DRAFT_20123170 [Suillus brevipes Sb2]|nr:hypothetical protein P692DRAFT_20123170 [Suillus brevipes Sb2]